MNNAHHYCAAINFAYFAIFSTSIFLLLNFPDGGHRARRWWRRLRRAIPAYA